MFVKLKCISRVDDSRDEYYFNIDRISHLKFNSSLETEIYKDGKYYEVVGDIEEVMAKIEKAKDEK